MKSYWSKLDLHGKIETCIIVGLSVLVAVLLALCVYKNVSSSGLDFPSEVPSSLMWPLIIAVLGSWAAGSLAVMRRF